MSAYYNEIDPFAAQWLRNLIAAGHIAHGVVDTRPIQEVSAPDVKRFTQCHWFAGIGGWSLALRLAGWSDDRPVWTGSCPCQPFSAAGKRGGGADDRHLWPHWRRLIGECRPTTIFGEQVEAAIGWGWLDAVCADLEAAGYATGSAVLPAAGVGAPHIRQRVWFVADADGGHPGTEGLQRGGQHGLVAHDGRVVLMGDADDAGLEGRLGMRGGADQRAAGPSGVDGFWSACDWLPCTDGKARPVEPGTFPLAHGVPGRVGRLRAYGNAIVPQVAAAFITACV